MVDADPDQLKQRRTAAKSNVTKRINRLVSAMTDFSKTPSKDKLPRLKKRHEAAEDAMERFRDAHELYYGVLNLPEGAERTAMDDYREDAEQVWAVTDEDYAEVLDKAEKDLVPPPTPPPVVPPAPVQALGPEAIKAIWGANFKAKDHIATFDGKDIRKFSAFINSWLPLSERMEEMGFTAIERFTQLKKCLNGDALKSIENLPHERASLELALGILRHMYGSTQQTTNSILDELKHCKPMGFDHRSIKEFFMVVHGTYQAMRAMGMELTDAATKNMFVNLVEPKLSTPVARDWSKSKIRKVDAEGKPSWTIDHLLNTLSEAVQVAEDLKSRPDTRKKFGSKPESTRPNNSALPNNFSNTILPATGNAMATGAGYPSGGRSGPPRTYPPCLFCEKSGHSHFSCTKSKEMSAKQRMDIVAQKKVCRLCFNPKHLSKDCRSKERNLCRKCGKEHHTLLHMGAAPSVNMLQCMNASIIVQHQESGWWPASHVVSAKIMGDDKKFHSVQILLDSGSQVTLVTDELLNELGLKGEPTELSLNTMNGRCTRKGQKVKMDLVSCFEDKSITVEAFSVKGPISVDPRAADSPNDYVDILLGEPYWSDVIEGKYPREAGKPTVWKTIFGHFLGNGVPIPPKEQEQ